MGGIEGVPIAAVTAVVGILGFAFAVFRYIAGIRDALGAAMRAEDEKLATRVATESEKAQTRIDAAVEQMRLMVEAVREGEARSRNELSANLQSALIEVRRDTKALDEKVTSMRVEMIRRSDLSDAINGVLTALDRQEKRFEALMRQPLHAGG